MSLTLIWRPNLSTKNEKITPVLQKKSRKIKETISGGDATQFRKN